MHTYEESPSFDPANIILHHGRLRRYENPLVTLLRPGKELRILKQWAGGTEYAHCGRFRLEFMKRNFARLVKIAPITATYQDVTTCRELYECTDPAHPMTREEDVFWRNEALKCIRDFGIAVESEMPQEYALHNLDAAHFCGPPPAGVSIPLWELVYHDALVVRHLVGPIPSAWGPVFEDMEAGFLRALLTGDSIMVLPQAGSLTDPCYREWLSTVCGVVQRLHGEVAPLEMVDHRFLAED